MSDDDELPAQVIARRVDESAARILLRALDRVESPARRQLLASRLMAAHRARAQERVLKPLYRLEETVRYQIKRARSKHESAEPYEQFWRDLRLALKNAAAARDEP